MKPIIGIIGRRKQINNNENTVLQLDYVKAVIKGGGIPLIIPVINNDEYMINIINSINGLLIPGGIDVNPKFFGENILPLCGEIDDLLDEFELKMINLARIKELPILGICRGHQVLNVAYGGSLFQDLSYFSNYDGTVIHAQDKISLPKQNPIHEIKIVNDSYLFEMFGSNLNTNSFHHQSVKEVGNGLKVTAYSNDNIVEAIESNVDKFVLGVQWHPEKTVDFSDEQIVIFKKFIDVCKQIEN